MTELTELLKLLDKGKTLNLVEYEDLYEGLNVGDVSLNRLGYYQIFFNGIVIYVTKDLNLLKSKLNRLTKKFSLVVVEGD